MSDRYGHIERFNDLVEHGWLAVLSHIELKVWLAYEKYADVDGNAHPGPSRLAKHLGHAGPKHVRDARAQLQKYGLLELEDEKPGQTRGVRLRVPPSAPSREERCKPAAPIAADIPRPSTTLPGIGGGSDRAVKTSEPSPDSVLPPYPKSAPHPPPIPEPTLPGFGPRLRTTHGTTHDQPRKQTTGPAAGRQADGKNQSKAHGTSGPRQRGTGPLTPPQIEAKKAFMDWWLITWPRFHNGDEFEFQGARDASATQFFLDAQQIAWDLDWAKEVALLYLALPEMYGLADHPLWKLARGANGYSRKLRNQHAQGNRHVLRPTQPNLGRPGILKAIDLNRPRPSLAAGAPRAG